MSKSLLVDSIAVMSESVLVPEVPLSVSVTPISSVPVNLNVHEAVSAALAQVVVCSSLDAMPRTSV